jgi:Type III restriction enzyme, res subunit
MAPRWRVRRRHPNLPQAPPALGGPQTREPRVAREGAETAIFLTEVAGRIHGYPDWRQRLEPENAAHNAGLPRVALKMATGSGKTVVMAMLIAWQTLTSWCHLATHGSPTGFGGHAWYHDQGSPACAAAPRTDELLQPARSDPCGSCGKSGPRTLCHHQRGDEGLRGELK